MYSQVDISPPKVEIAPIDKVSEDSLGQVEAQRVETASSSSSCTPLSTGGDAVQAKIEKVSRDQGQPQGREQPQRERRPEDAVDEDKQIGHLDGVCGRVESPHGGNGREVPQGEKLVEETDCFEEERDDLDGFGAADGGAEGAGALFDAGAGPGFADGAAEFGCLAVDGVCDDCGGWREGRLHGDEVASWGAR